MTVRPGSTRRSTPTGDRTPVIVAARRTPVGTAGHALAALHVIGLAAPVLAALRDDLTSLGVTASVDEVVLGNVMGPGGNPARVAALAAGLGTAVPGVTVDRQCGSGQEAVHAAAASVLARSADLVLAGGVESASTAPTRMWPAAPGEQPVPYGRAPFAPADVGDPDMGPAAQDVADRCGIERERQDAYALRSHRLTIATAEAGGFDAEMVPVAGVSKDERPRPRLRPEVLARMPGAFTPGG